MTDKAALSVSLIIPVRNGGPPFKRCLSAIAASTVRPDELWVVDDGSSDQTADWARDAGAVVLRTDRPGSGPAAARNLAARNAAGDILFFCDADVELKPDSIARVLDTFERTPDLAALFGSYDDQPAAPGFLSQYKNLFHHYIHQQGNAEAATFWSGCGAIRRSIFLELGGFSSRYEIPSIEDIELGYQLRSSGHRIRLDKSLQVKHLKQWTLPSLLYSDIVARGIPWTRLILREGAFLNDLNLQIHNRISVVTVYLTLCCLISGFWRWPIWIGAPLGGATLLLLNRHFYGFLLRRRGLGFVCPAIGAHWLYYFYNGISFGLGAAAHLVEQAPNATPIGSGRRSALSAKRLYAIPIAGVLLLATLLRFHALGAHSLWLDELLEIGVAGRAPTDIFTSLLKYGAMPLDYLATYLALKIGQQDFWLRVLPAFWSILSVAVTYRLAGRLLGRAAGLTAALVIAASAFHVQYAQETRPYALFGLLSLASFYFLLRGLRTGRFKYWLAYTASTILCLFTHYFTLFLMAAQFVLAIVESGGRWPARETLKRGGYFSGSVVVVILALAATPTFGNVWDVGKVFLSSLAKPVTLSEAAELKPNKDQGPVLDQSLFNDQLLQVLSGGGQVWRWVFLALIAAGLAAAVARGPRLALLLSIWVIVPVGLTLLFLVHRGTFFAVRYVTPAFFPLVFLIAAALQAGGGLLVSRLRRGRWLIWGVIAAVPLSFSLDRVVAYYETPKEDWRAAGELISINYRTGDSVDAPLGGAVIFHYADAARPGQMDTTSAADLAAVRGRLWVVMHPYIGPAEGGLRDWLEAQPSTVEYRIDETISLFVVDNARRRAELMAEIQTPPRAITMDGLARQYADSGLLDHADAAFRQSLSLSQAPVYRVHYANFLRMAGRSAEAAQLYEAVLAVDAQEAQALSGLGRIYYDRGSYSAAVELLSRAVTLAPGDYAANYFLFQSYDRLGKAVEAAHYREAAAQLLPDLIEPP